MDFNLNNYVENAKIIKSKHFSQQITDIHDLQEKYKTPVCNQSMGIWELVQKLALVIDPTDKDLLAASQWVHTIQVIYGMEQDGIQDEQLFVAAWLHDIGKILLLHGEKPENVVCDNYVISGNQGLDNCICHWNHDEFAYQLFKDSISYEMSWLIRYHSIRLEKSHQFMDTKDKKLCEKYLIPFRKYDKETKSYYFIPQIDLEKHQKMLEKYFPCPVVF